MAGGSRRDRITDARNAWLAQAFLARHAGRLTPDELRRTVEQVRRHTDTPPVLDESGSARTVRDVDP